MTFVGVTDDGSLQFAESEAKEVKLTPFNWSRSCQLSDKYFARYKNGNGVSSLAEMALRSVVKYRHALTADVLEDVPWDPLGEKVCEKIKDMRGLTVSVWKEFVGAYASEKEAGSKLNALVAPTILPVDLLAPSFALMDSLDLSFLTLITVVNQPMDLSRWMSFCDLQNLRALLVDTGRLPTRFDDRVSKGWAVHARENGRLKHLYSFSLCSMFNRQTITRQAMVQLQELPNLTLICLRGIRPEAPLSDSEDCGWTRQRPSWYEAHSTGTARECSFEALYNQQQLNWPSADVENAVPKLVVRVGNSADANVFRLSYSAISSFAVMVRNAAERSTSTPTFALPASYTFRPPQRPKIRKKAQKGFSDMLSSFGERNWTT